MALSNIETLLEKYNNAETTLAEEAQLKAYFTGNNVAPHLEHYKPLFNYFSIAHNEQYTGDVPLNTKKNKRLYQWISVAAGIVLLLGIAIPQLMGPTEAEKQEALLAYNQTMDMFKLISLGMNESKTSADAFSIVADNITDGKAKIQVLSEVSKINNKIINNN